MKQYKELENFTSKFVSKTENTVRTLRYNSGLIFNFVSILFRSTDYGDELTWAAAWLYKATNDSEFIEESEQHYDNFRLKERPNEFFYNKKVAGVQVIIRQIS